MPCCPRLGSRLPVPVPHPLPLALLVLIPLPLPVPVPLPLPLPLPLQVGRKPTWFFGCIQAANEDGTFEVRLTLALPLPQPWPEPNPNPNPHLGRKALTFKVRFDDGKREKRMRSDQLTLVDDGEEAAQA